MAYLIKTIYHHKHEVINIGIADISPETKLSLVQWADKVVVMDRDLLDKIYGENVVLADVGKDIWHNPQAEELIHKCLKYIKDLNL